MRLLVAAAPILISSLWLVSAFSCNPSYEQMERFAERDRAIEESYLLRLADEVDLIILGRVIDVEDASSQNYAQEAIISVEKILKGSENIATASALMYKVDSPDIGADPEAPADLSDIPECGAPYEPQNEEPYILEGFRALFYIQKGILVRVNAFPIQPELLRFDAAKEVQFLDQRASGKE